MTNGKVINDDKSNVNWYFLRYADVLLLYAEALNEWKGAPTDKAYEAVRGSGSCTWLRTSFFNKIQNCRRNGPRTIPRNRCAWNALMNWLSKVNVVLIWYAGECIIRQSKTLKMN